MLLLAFACVLAAAPRTARAQALVPLEHTREVAAHIAGSERCGECHENAYRVWKQTPHAESFEKLQKKKRAAGIAKKLGVRLIKRNSPCLTCHFTPKLRGENVSAASGVSCESCHGAGGPWIDVHNDTGGDPAAESADHREQRIARARELGMRRPSDLYPVVANCFQCHLVPNQQLVEQGGHTTGTAGFEFVEYSQDKGIRHNFLAAELAGRGVVNAERDAARRRVMFVVGEGVGLEYSLRGAAVATSDGDYLDSMRERVSEFGDLLGEIAELGPVPEAARMAEIAHGTTVDADADAALIGAADRVGEQVRAFLARADGETLAALDELLSGGAGEEEPGDELALEAGGGEAEEASAGATGAGASAAAASAATLAAGGRPPVGKFKRRIRPASAHKTVKASACTASCHRDPVSWLKKHAHAKSHAPFLAGARPNLAIAQLYGLGPGDAVRGDAVCMDCHATVQSGREKSKVRSGVSCQECHGGAADYLKPHREGGLGVAKSLGMKDLSNASVLAETCTGCHYVTDERLLSSGHPSGQDFDYARGVAAIQHWDGGIPTGAFSAAIAQRGPVPDVPLGELPDGVSLASGAAGGGGRGTPGGAGGRSASRSSGAGVRGGSEEAFDEESSEPVALDLPARTDLPEAATVEETLEAVQRRIEAIHRQLGNP